MSYHRALLAPAALALAVLVVGGGCKGCAERSPPAEGARGQDVPSRQLQPLDERVLALSGEIDVENRYPSAVMVTTALGEEGSRNCSGVLIHPRLVLTAGHCVCMRRDTPAGERRSGLLINASACAPIATVTTVVYRPPRKTDLDRRGHDGEVQPHPELEVLLDPEGKVASSRADLAVILLKDPLGTDFHPVPLADEEVRLEESITIVGYGYDELSDGHNGDRRFSENRVTQAGGPGARVRVSPPGHHLYKGDSGGPCLREGPRGATLVGISARGLGDGAAFTSTFDYREWLREQIRMER